MDRRKFDSALVISPLMSAPNVRVPLEMMEHSSLLTTLSNFVEPGAAQVQVGPQQWKKTKHLKSSKQIGRYACTQSDYKYTEFK